MVRDTDMTVGKKERLGSSWWKTFLEELVLKMFLEESVLICSADKNWSSCQWKTFSWKNWHSIVQQIEIRSQCFESKIGLLTKQSHVPWGAIVCTNAGCPFSSYTNSCLWALVRRMMLGLESWSHSSFPSLSAYFVAHRFVVIYENIVVLLLFWIGQRERPERDRQENRLKVSLWYLFCCDDGLLITKLTVFWCGLLLDSW
jgi:hypothetical protein